MASLRPTICTMLVTLHVLGDTQATFLTILGARTSTNLPSLNQHPSRITHLQPVVAARPRARPMAPAAQTMTGTASSGRPPAPAAVAAAVDSDRPAPSAADSTRTAQSSSGWYMAFFLP